MLYEVLIPSNCQTNTFFSFKRGEDFINIIILKIYIFYIKKRNLGFSPKNLFEIICDTKNDIPIMTFFLSSQLCLTL